MVWLASFTPYRVCKIPPRRCFCLLLSVRLHCCVVSHDVTAALEISSVVSEY